MEINFIEMGIDTIPKIYFVYNVRTRITPLLIGKFKFKMIQYIIVNVNECEIPHFESKYFPDLSLSHSQRLSVARYHSLTLI